MKSIISFASPLWNNSKDRGTFKVYFLEENLKSLEELLRIFHNTTANKIARAILKAPNINAGPFKAKNITTMINDKIGCLIENVIDFFNMIIPPFSFCLIC